jgi:oligopeptide/dipeptide ABC transporter ATP-binding protein
MPALLDVRGLTVELPTERGWVRPVNEVSFSLADGETLGIVGESGSGKTMLSLALMGLTPPLARRHGEANLRARAAAAQGAKQLDGSSRGAKHAEGSAFPANGEQAAENADPSAQVLPRDDASTCLVRSNLLAASPREMRAIRGREIAMIFQEPMTALNPLMRVGAQIEEAIRVHDSQCSPAEAHRRAVEALQLASVPEPEVRARQYPHQLSGGLRQRALIAMALSAKPRVLIADEPTTALDVTVQKQILELLIRLQRELGLAMIFITHDLGVVAEVAGRVAVMYAGRVIEEGPTRDVLREPRHPYTAGLLRAAPQLPRGHLTPIPGAVPAFDALPPGCSFAPRCEFHRAECDEAVPDLFAVDPARAARCILVEESVAR